MAKKIVKTLNFSIGDDPIYTEKADLFGFSSKAKKLSSIIYNISTYSGVCGGIVGDWGSGKSSFMKLMDEQIKINFNNKTCSVWFTAWDPGGLQDLQDAMLFQFFKQLCEKKEMLHVSKEEQKQLEDLFNDLKNSLGLRKTMKERIRQGLATFSKIVPGSESYIQVADKFLEELDSTRKIKTIFQNLAMWLTRNKISVFFFIDDIDRTNPECIRDILSEIKVYINNPRIATILGYDYNYVVKALKEPILPKGIDPQRFLEKIITINLPLPKPSKNNFNILTKKVLEDFKLIPKDLYPKLNNLAVILTNSNPRRIKSLFLTYALLVPDSDLGDFGWKSALIICAAANMGILNNHLVRDAFYEDKNEKELHLILDRFTGGDEMLQEKINDLKNGMKYMGYFSPKIIKKLNL